MKARESISNIGRSVEGSGLPGYRRLCNRDRSLTQYSWTLHARFWEKGIPGDGDGSFDIDKGAVNP